MLCFGFILSLAVLACPSISTFISLIRRYYRTTRAFSPYSNWTTANVLYIPLRSRYLLSHPYQLSAISSKRVDISLDSYIRSHSTFYASVVYRSFMCHKETGRYSYFSQLPQTEQGHRDTNNYDFRRRWNSWHLQWRIGFLCVRPFLCGPHY